jgi:iron uptake system component EfeO
VSRFDRRARIAAAVFGIAAAFGIAAVLAACGGSTSSAGPAASLPAGAMAVEAKEYSFTPSTLSAPAGSVTFSVTNAGNENHEFEVMTGDQSLAKIASFSRGATQAVSVSLEPGTYTFACRLNGHDQLGMKGTLTVTGG